ncbi:hypothetical protein CKF54_01955 [Psittacicella hinzii]|uniref:HTH lysR-type domain-containing protein n=1 Tax=Psittacicella hinzii TaxID=2028575 RepID=A0A3A1Y8L5_9GAMM|nr:LysR substrate-binding domain-containing protein [Psittacicella hinzii]RIY34005.1 hypothetical protein CKF54_01955 [Psittacicella hinzii]
MSLDLSTIQLKDIKYLLAVYRMKSFRKAAEVCDVTQATISGQIAKVERVLNLQLIKRNSRSITFTPSSKPIIEQFEKISDEFKLLSDMAFNEQKRINGGKGEFVIGVIPTFAPFFEHTILDKLRDKFSDYTFTLVELTTNRIREELKYNSLDFALVANHPLVEDMNTVYIGDDELVALINRDNPNLSLEDINLQDIKDSKIFLLQDSNCLRDQVIDICNTSPNPNLGIDNLTDIRYNASTIDTLKMIVHHNMGISVVPAVSLFSPTPARAKVNRIVNHPKREISMVYDPESQNSKFLAKISQELIKLYEKEYKKLRLDSKIYKPYKKY